MKEVTVTTEERLEQAAAAVEVILKQLETGATTKSTAFRELYKLGLTIGQIANTTGSHYSFVYGVISSHFGKAKTTSKNSKSDEIRELAAQGLTPGQIATRLNSNYSFVHSVVKKWKLQQTEETPKPESIEE
ncbi:MAG: hypothetical protein DDT23_01059 [candidate division WS2 bacterium]|nr:hypothetical protein [Candidatus Lithacetigena glycinireducens]